MKFVKGHAKAGGRKRGSVNRSTAAVKAAVQEAFVELGGVPALVAWARKNRTAFYMLWAKLLPLELRTPDGEALRVAVVEEVVGAAAAEVAGSAPADVTDYEPLGLTVDGVPRPARITAGPADTA